MVVPSPENVTQIHADDTDFKKQRKIGEYVSLIDFRRCGGVVNEYPCQPAICRGYYALDNCINKEGHYEIRFAPPA
jgi:hypothetical protein